MKFEGRRLRKLFKDLSTSIGERIGKFTSPRRKKTSKGKPVSARRTVRSRRALKAKRTA